MQLSPVLLSLCLSRYSLIKWSRSFFYRTHAFFSTVGRWCSLNCWVNILSFPCSSRACLRPSLFHAVQTYSQRQNKFPHDNFYSSYYSNKVKCYQTGIMLKISAKNLQLQRQKPGDSKPKLLQLCSPAHLQQSNPAVNFALMSPSTCPDFDPLVQPGTTGRLPGHLAECSAPRESLR